jgi:hypothetical protein
VPGTVGFIRQMETEFEHQLTLKLIVFANPESPYVRAKSLYHELF